MANLNKKITNRFILFYKKLTIGTLSVKVNEWHFKYSMEFKRQEKIVPLLDFPDKNREYISENLWPFFEARIPSLRNPMIKSVIDKKKIDPTNIVLLLREFGHRTITNPFILEEG
jgi:HipA-like protein